MAPYCIYKPSFELSQLVSHYWVFDGPVAGDRPIVHRTLANFYPELIFHYGGAFKEIVKDGKTENTFTGGLHGQTDRIRRFTHTEPCGIFGIMLQPYAIPVLFGIPSSLVKNQLVDLRDLIGAEGRIITEKMISAKSNGERVILANGFLTSRLKKIKYPQLFAVVKKIYNSNGLTRVDTLVDEACLSQRQFERIFKEQIGFSAKSFMNIVRFKSLITAYNKGRNILTDLAYEYGYYDQSHFIKDFKAFSGYTPRVYFNGGASEIFYAPR